MWIAAAVVAVSLHGALGNPPSRAALCGPEGGASARSAACQAAGEAGEAGALAAFDDIRLPDVNGRDRAVVPDGKLCSGGLSRFAGLDLPRADWPATELTAGARFTFEYRVTIPHRGRFRLYVTRDGYSPSRPLTWDDLEERPFLSVTDPARRNGSYVLPGRLPKNKSGRHIIYTIWQTADTPDTYYSCSDVVFPAAREPLQETGTPVPLNAENQPRLTAGSGRPGDLPLPATAASMVLALGGTAGVLLLWRRRRS